jgi:hypothetical protein
MFRSLRSVLSVVAAATISFLVFGPELRAQTGERSRWDQATLGNATVGVDIVGWARTRNVGTERRVDEAMMTQLTLLGPPIEMQRIAATAIRVGTSFAASANLRRGGLTVRSNALTASGTVAYTTSAAVFGTNQTLGINLMGFTLAVRANVSHTGVMNLSLLNWPTSDGSMLSGIMQSHASGWAVATSSVAGLQLSVQYDLRFGSQGFDGVLGAFPGYLSTAYLGYDLSALRLFLRIAIGFGPFSNAVTLVDATAPARHLAPFLP